MKAGSPSRPRECGQASIELLAGIPLLILGALVGFQLAVTGYALHLADGAAEAGALAVAAGTDANAAARAALPEWATGDVDVEEHGGRVSVSVRPPAPLPAISRALEVTSRAWAQGSGGG